MSLISVEEVGAIMATGLEADALQAVIDREEAWLAAKIGPLVGERTETLRPVSRYQPILLQRPTDAGSGGDLSVVDGGTELTSDQFVLRGTAVIARVGTWGSIVEPTYTPTDEELVRRVLLELVRLTVTSSPYQSESTEGHSYTRPTDLERQRAQLARTLDPHRGPQTLVVSR
jgi:hypothetical protein